jgi:hypothetical protein
MNGSAPSAQPLRELPFIDRAGVLRSQLQRLEAFLDDPRSLLVQVWRDTPLLSRAAKARRPELRWSCSSSAKLALCSTSASSWCSSACSRIARRSRWI